MRRGNTGFPAALASLWFLISGVLAQVEDNNMNGNVAVSEKLVYQSQSLCDGEQAYIQKRKFWEVLEALNGLEINCTADSVPHIALAASGGGQRSAVALVGALHQMQKENLLDTLLYVGGVSGSTWSMASLYSDPQWSRNMEAAESSLSGPGVKLEEALGWLQERSKDELFSLSDVWGVLTSAGIMKRMDLRHLSDEASRNTVNPYPIYCALEKYCHVNGPTEGKWFEVSPHEAGFIETGFFIETPLLGSKFRNGELLERKPEMDMVKLQGFLGCALAHEEAIKDFIPLWMKVPVHVDSAAQEYLRIYNTLDKIITLTKNIVEDPVPLSTLDELQKALGDKINQNESALLESKTLEERKSLFQQWSQEMLSTVDTWSQNLEEGAFKTYASLLTNQILPLIMKWEWGTTPNYLYQYQDSSVPTCLQSEENLHLIDAGLLINSAYPSFLGDKRDIDLIIAPEYSAGDMFEPLTLARDYAAKLKKPFPEINETILEDKDWPKDCYVFEGKEKEPTIIYMPLFNRQNCKDAEEIKAKMEEYSTFQLPFKPDKIKFVLETAKANIKNNKEILLREIKKAVIRRQNKRSVL